MNVEQAGFPQLVQVSAARPGVYKCREAFTIRNGTIFEESRLPLHKWFLAIFLLHSLKKGISSIQIAKTIGVTQKTAWFMLLACAMR